MERLSADLLYFTFLHLLPSVFDSTTPTLCTVAPFNLSLVSRSWRALVLSHPSLWASIHVEDHPISARRKERLCRLMEGWLRGSGSSPLTIHLRLGQDGKSTLDDPQIDLLRILEGESYRWRDVHVRTAVHGLSELSPAMLLPGSSSLLMSLTLRFPPSLPQPIAHLDLSSSIAGGVPSALQVLRINTSTKLLLPPSRDALRLPHLRVLSFTIEDGGDLDDTLALLRSAPNLERLRLEDASTLPPATPNSLHTDIISLPRLINIVLQSGVESTMNCLLGHLSCPSLRTFALRAPALPDDIDDDNNHNQKHPPSPSNQMPHLLRFFERSRPLTLTVLQLVYQTPLGDQPLAPGTAYSCAHTLRKIFSVVGGSLQKLVLSGPIIDRSVISLLSLSSSSSRHPSPTSPPPICPLLSNLSLYHHPSSQEHEIVAHAIEMNLIEEMVFSRWQGGAGALRTISMHLPAVKDVPTTTLVAWSGEKKWKE